MNALRIGLDATIDKVRDISAQYSDSGPSTNGFGVGRGERERDFDRTATGAPKVETGYYSSGKMQGFGSDGKTHRSDDPAHGEGRSERRDYSSGGARMQGFGREDGRPTSDARLH